MESSQHFPFHSLLQLYLSQLILQMAWLMMWFVPSLQDGKEQPVDWLRQIRRMFD